MTEPRMRASRIGRPALCTPEITGAISELVRAGTYPQIAAQANGISRTTYFNWMARGRRARERNDEGFPIPASDRDYVAFLNSIEQAEAEAEGIATTHLMKALETMPSAAVALLERRFGKRWSMGDDAQDRPGPATPVAASSRGWASLDELAARPGPGPRGWAAAPQEGGVGPIHSQSLPPSKIKLDANRRDIGVSQGGRSGSRRGAPVRGSAGKSAKDAPTPIRPRVGRRVALHTPPSPAR